MWFSAEFLYVEEHSSTNCVGDGVIVDPERDGSEKGVHEVDFLPLKLLQRHDYDIGEN